VAQRDLNYTNQIRFPEKWRPFIRLGSHMYIMTCHSLSGIKYAPLYIHSFQLLKPRRLLEAERFNIKYTSPSEIAKVADKLRYYRHKKGLRQRDVAEKTGIHLATYCAYEQEDRIMPYPFDNLGKIAELFSVEITDLLDNYNLFLFNGQGRQIRALRQSLGLTKEEFGKLYGFHVYTVNKWENDSVQILKSTWVKLFAKNK
jgi:transcriptional regulator with XRE-family HTH domain